MKHPHVIVHTFCSLDGRVSLGPDRTAFDDVGDVRWGDEWASEKGIDCSRRDLIERFHPQVFLEGSGSFVREGAALRPLPQSEYDADELLQDFLPDSVVGRPGHVGWLACVDGRGRVRAGMKEFPGWEGWHTLHLVATATPVDYLAFLRREGIPYLVSGEERVDLAGALGTMAELLGVTCVISTAGSRLNGALLREDLVDEVDLVFLPLLVGGDTTPALFGGANLAPSESPARLELLSAGSDAAGRVHARYRVVRREAR